MIYICSEAADAAKRPEVSKEPADVNCLTYYQNGFAFAIHNALHVFEKETNYRYSKKTIITIPIDIYPSSLYRIKNVAINVQMDAVIVTTLHNQIYIGMLVVPETLKVKQLTFQTLGEPLHIKGIIGMSVCSWKPIVMTAGESIFFCHFFITNTVILAMDQTIRIWNYETGKVELVKKYQVDVTTIALHPSGMFVAVGFSDQLRLMQILLDDLKVTWLLVPFSLK